MKTLSTLSIVVALVALLSIPILVQAVETPTERVNVLDLGPTGVAINGYDPVAYFTESRAVKGDSTYQSKIGNAIYYFASLKNKQLFDTNPQKYRPQFGGFSGAAMTVGELSSGDPRHWTFVDGRLVLHHSEEARGLFANHLRRNFAHAYQTWWTILMEQFVPSS